MDNADVCLLKSKEKFDSKFKFQDDEDGDEAEEESEGGEQDDEMDAQQGPGSPGHTTNVAGGVA